MIKLNLDKTKIEKNKFEEHKNVLIETQKKINNRTGVGSEFMDWLYLMNEFNYDELNSMKMKIKELNSLGVEKLLVIGIGGSYLGAKAGIDFINGSDYDKIKFVGINVSSDYFKKIENWIKSSEWSIVFISKSGTTLEPSIAFRYFRKLLEEKYENANKRIIAITDKNTGTLKNMASKNNWTSFIVPDGIGGRFSGITPVGLFPMLFAGIDIDKLLIGVKKAQDELNNDIDNNAYKYALSRYILNHENNYDVEIFCSYDPDLFYLIEWLKQLFGESEGKDGKGIFPSSASYTADLHSLGQWIQEGKRNLVFETTIWVEESNNKILINESNENDDNLGEFSNIDLDKINHEVKNAVIDAHFEGNVPQIQINISKKTEEELGYLWYFFFISVSVSAYLIDVNPFNQPGVELYKNNLKMNLKKLIKNKK